MSVPIVDGPIKRSRAVRETGWLQESEDPGILTHRLVRPGMVARFEHVVWLSERG